MTFGLPRVSAKTGFRPPSICAGEKCGIGDRSHMLPAKRALLLSVLLTCAAAFAAADAPPQDGTPSRRQKQQAERKKLEGMLFVLWAAAPLAVVISLGGLGLQAAYRATFVRRSDLVTAAAVTSPVKCAIVGFVNSALLLTIMAASGEKLPGLGFAGALVLAVLMFLGVTVKSENLGVRIARAAGRECSPIVGLVIGWPAIVCILLVPVVGWLVVAYLLVSGVGAVFLSFVGGRRSEAKEEPEAPAEEDEGPPPEVAP